MIYPIGTKGTITFASNIRSGRLLLVPKGTTVPAVVYHIWQDGTVSYNVLTEDGAVRFGTNLGSKDTFTPTVETPVLAQEGTATTSLTQLLTAAHECAAALINDQPAVAASADVIATRLAQLDAAPTAREIERFLQYLNWLATGEAAA